jgi:2',3'-cyclic-nucleotide 2'-phosphodiesterase/3'-nucleotidase
MKYDAINLGNHEFNFGLDMLKKVVVPSHSSVLSANTRSVQTNAPWQYVKPYVIKEIDVSNTTGIADDMIRIGIIGTVTPAIPSFETPQNYRGVNFTSQEDAINANIGILKQQKVDAIVVLTHSGIPSTSSPYPENGTVSIAKNCPGIDLIVSGHTHVRTAQNMTDFASSNIDNSVTPSVTYADGVVNGVPTMAPYRWGAYLAEGLISFVKENGKWQVQDVNTALLSSNNVADDAAIVAMAQPWDSAIKAYLNTPVGTSTGPYHGSNGDKMYTPLVDLINQAQLFYGNATVSAAACFSSTALIPQGNVTIQNVSSVYVFENYMFTIQITGKQLKQYLELSACYYDQVAVGTPVDGLEDATNLSNVTTKTSKWPSYNYDMLTGVNYQINISKQQGSRIQDLTYTQTGIAVKDTDTIKLAMNNYRFNGGGPLGSTAAFPQAKGLGGFMAAMGLDALGRNGLAKPTILCDSQKSMGDAGQVRDLLERYIKTKKSISPNTTANWNLTSN